MKVRDNVGAHHRIDVDGYRTENPGPKFKRTGSLLGNFKVPAPALFQERDERKTIQLVLQAQAMTALRSDVMFKDMTKKEKGVLRLWQALGLKIEWRCSEPKCDCDKEWEDFYYPNNIFDYKHANFRLKP